MEGYTNRLLGFDLTKNEVKVCAPEQELYDKYLGAEASEPGCCMIFCLPESIRSAARTSC